ncbi:MAG: aminotransferase class V-fold PLP-dependent enzyme [Ktedonobacteraceae bacterium]|nr:aminotransferase class V-fold PLP-dependent enzyme [Ktedonobacteraceae bacterium]
MEQHHSSSPHTLCQEPDFASIDGLAIAVGALLPALEQFCKFDQPERTAIERALWSARLEEPLPQAGSGSQAVLARLRDVVIPNGLRAGDPGFSGWVATQPTTIPAVAHLAAAISGPLCVAVQAYNLLENLAMRWLRDLVGLPANYQGIFTSGGSVANLIGLGAARQYAFERHGIDPAQYGISALPHPRMYASTQVHHVMYRAAAVLGLGRRAVVTIPTDDALRLDIAKLKERLETDCAEGCTPIAIVASAGTINTGTIDPLPELIQLCQEKDIWLHVDGAYGLLGILDSDISHLYGDLSRCDSLVVDPHKWLATSMGCGAIYVRDGKLLERAFTLEPAVYIEESLPIYTDDAPITSQFDDLGYVFHNFGVEHSLPSRGVEVWAVLKEIGVEGVKARVCRHNWYARYLADLVGDAPNLELVAPVTLSTCCFRYVPDALRGRKDAEAMELLNRLNRTILGRIHERGQAIPSATLIDGAFVIRACFINPRTTLTSVEAHAREVELCGAEVWATMEK